jgi:hypothetical protein
MHGRTQGVFGLSSQESTPFKFKGQLCMMESVGCGGCVERNGGKDCGPEWDNITQMDPAFLNHSYVRVREIGSGRCGNIFVRHLKLKTEHLPRQARDKHRKS